MRGTQTSPDQPEIVASPDLQEAGVSRVEAAAFLNVPVSAYGANCLAQLLFVCGFIPFPCEAVIHILWQPLVCLC